MKCIRCGNETYKSTTTEAIELGNGVLVIRNIPCYKCEVCDEIHFTGDVVKQLENIIALAKKQMQQFSVIDFESSKTAA
ncbi:YgiT-type zinc finger domain-containing protein [Treponema sp. JC4]|uniref:type II toxin-antitoxin system MqsA family antitoxin n=1 Tax=Treponema sp. JC4 TaxID=1124982 RepID=UPI00025AFC05|nr:type II toxin-antitoxin system MqsA family antitoxin [Treponema sp. JC4]EID84859.1 YgiT-type zinc finger domain-containing protein [Treponema sp. JC4]